MDFDEKKDKVQGTRLHSLVYVPCACSFGEGGIGYPPMIGLSLAALRNALVRVGLNQSYRQAGRDVGAIVRTAGRIVPNTGFVDRRGGICHEGTKAQRCLSAFVADIPSFAI